MKKAGILFSFAIGSSSAFAATKQPKQPAPIRQEMDGLYATMSDLLPLVLNKAAFEDKKNKKEIAGHMNRLSALTKKMAANSQRFADNDPSIPYIMERFAGDIRMSISMWNTGDREIPRRLLRNVTDYCISCHTRTGKGAHFNDVVQSSRFKTMPALNKAEYLAATRQFEEALLQYENVLVDRPLAKTDPGAWSNAVRKMLAITIRVKNDPSLTLEMISRIQENPDSMPPSLRADIGEWRRSAKAWSEEKAVPSPTDEQRFSEVKRLMAEADEIIKSVPGGALVQQMRASTILHEMLGRMHSGEHYQELLWRAGESASYLRDFNMWTLQDIYYETCVRAGGDKSLSNKCLAALESSMLQSYGAASKAGLPDFVKTQLDGLKASIK